VVGGGACRALDRGWEAVEADVDNEQGLRRGGALGKKKDTANVGA
jgi:hypothetical protein